MSYDFFAGSGTTFHALIRLNQHDDGKRQCILVTNNEVSGEEADSLRSGGFLPGEDEWDQQGICRSVTWPRSKLAILGRSDDGTALPGEYLSGRTIKREKPRRVTQIGFVEPGALDRPAKKKQLVALIEGLPQTLVKEPCHFIVSEDHKASVLFEEGAAEDWLAALDGQDQITDLYIVTANKARFEALKADVRVLLGPVLVAEEENRPLADGFAANLAYFRIEFLDKDRVALKRAFREIPPLLWLKAGAIGPRPELGRGEPEPTFLAPPDNPLAHPQAGGDRQPHPGAGPVRLSGGRRLAERPDRAQGRRAARRGRELAHVCHFCRPTCPKSPLFRVTAAGASTEVNRLAIRGSV